MLKIFVNVDRQDVTHSFSIGQTFPDVKGKLIRIEMNGKELSKLMEIKEIPICAADTSYLSWEGKQAGSILKVLREVFAQ